MVPSVSPSHVPLLPASQVPAVWEMLMPTLSPSQVPAVSPVQVPVVLPVQVPVVSPSHVPAVSPSQVPALSPSLVFALLPEQVPLVSPSQVSGLTKFQVPVVSPWQVPVVSPLMVPSVSPSHVPLLPASQVPAVWEMLMPTLSPSQVPAVSPVQVPVVLPVQVPVVSPSHVPAVSPSQVPALSPSQVPALSPVQAPLLTPLRHQLFLCPQRTRWFDFEAGFDDRLGSGDAVVAGSNAMRSTSTAYRGSYSVWRDGIDDQVAFMSPVDLTDASLKMTIGAWIRPDAVPSIRTTIFRGGIATSAPFEVFLSSTGYVCVTADVLVGDSCGSILSVPNSVWTHVMWRFDAVGGTSEVYVNGSAVTSSNFGSVPLTTAASTISLGRASVRNAAQTYFAGSFDNVMVWEGGESSSECMDLAFAQASNS
eukprot:TRINITY_DN6286_c2_g1_i1.p1 TRINITY_DN6286_c2_g1~~TRINITY_DN6286_c2_g1_i1.p1  ORF type:complete len:422 (+),score=119.69 TRINITY_DN6286_c2_g1_i1:149-1414(+)